MQWSLAKWRKLESTYVALTYLLQAQTNDAANGDVDSNKGILVDLLNLLGQTSKDATLKSLIFINQIEDELNEGEELGSNTKNFFVLLKEYLHASLDQHHRYLGDLELDRYV